VRDHLLALFQSIPVFAHLPTELTCYSAVEISRCVCAAGLAGPPISLRFRQLNVLFDAFFSLPQSRDHRLHDNLSGGRSSPLLLRPFTCVIHLASLSPSSPISLSAAGARLSPVLPSTLGRLSLPLLFSCYTSVLSHSTRTAIALGPVAQRDLINLLSNHQPSPRISFPASP